MVNLKKVELKKTEVYVKSIPSKEFLEMLKKKVVKNV